MPADNICLIACGSCCREYVPTQYASEAIDPEGPCPRLGEDGCTVPRLDRPTECRYYLCADASLDITERGRQG